MSIKQFEPAVLLLVALSIRTIMSQAVATKEQSSTNGPDVDFALSVPTVPETSSRTQAINTDRFVEKPSVARANVAVCAETPYGRSKYAQAHSDYVSQCH